MDLVDDIENGGFSFIWTIQNFNQWCDSGRDNLESPTFILELDTTTKWFLSLIRRGLLENSFCLYLSSKGICKIQLHFTLSIRFNCGSFKKYDKICTTNQAANDGFVIFKNVQELGAILDNGTLTIRCRMWKDDADLLKSVRCYAHTKICVNKIVYLWTLENFLARPNEKRSTKVHNMSTEASSFEICLLLGENGVYDFEVQPISIEKDKLNFYTCELSLLSADGNPAYSVRDEYWYWGYNDNAMIMTFLPKKKLLANEKLYLPDGTLSLLCEFTNSTCVESSKVERTEYGNTEYHQMGCSDHMAPSSLKDCLQRFYSEGKFTDVIIRDNNREFHAHKVILCARSEVFSAMFERDIKENRSGVVVKIEEDLGEGTISKMLLYIYTDIIEDLEWESAAQLYFAGDKYGIKDLKAKCMSFLRNNIDITNACDLLTLADKPQDPELKLIVQQFVFENTDEIMKSDKWKRFMQINSSLASETMYLLISKNSKVLNMT